MSSASERQPTNSTGLRRYRVVVTVREHYYCDAKSEKDAVAQVESGEAELDASATYFVDKQAEERAAEL